MGPRNTTDLCRQATAYNVVHMYIQSSLENAHPELDELPDEAGVLDTVVDLPGRLFPKEIPVVREARASLNRTRAWNGVLHTVVRTPGSLESHAWNAIRHTHAIDESITKPHADENTTRCVHMYIYDLYMYLRHFEKRRVSTF